MKRIRAFTLIELLVVIAIIAVLMGILMPALRRVKEQARQRSCATRVRQHVLTLHMYADDNQGKMPAPPDAGYWLWDIHIDTVNFMLKTGLTQALFFCPSNDNQQKYQTLFWEFGDNQWDGKKFTSGRYIVSGYCYLLEMDSNSGAKRPQIIDTGRGDGPKSWVKTNREKDQGRRELVVDATLGQTEPDTKHGYNFGTITVGGSWGTNGIHDRTSHLKSDEEPQGGNIGFLDSHVAWRSFDQMERRYGGSGSPAFFW
jgi:prepilin-type N-terminal cleavage/methylation domain-containing protein